MVTCPIWTSQRRDKGQVSSEPSGRRGNSDACHLCDLSGPLRGAWVSPWIPKFQWRVLHLISREAWCTLMYFSISFCCSQQVGRCIWLKCSYTFIIYFYRWNTSVSPDGRHISWVETAVILFRCPFDAWSMKCDLRLLSWYRTGKYSLTFQLKFISKFLS